MSNRYPKAIAGDSTFSAGGDYFDRLPAITALQDQATFSANRPTLDVRGTARADRINERHAVALQAAALAPVLGRAFTAEEGETGHELKVILSYGLWPGCLAATGTPSGVRSASTYETTRWLA